MTLHPLDPNVALVVIDLQTGVVALPTVHPIDGVIANTVALLDAFRAAGKTVALVNVSGGAPGRTENGKARGQVGGSVIPEAGRALIPELNAQDSDIAVTKQTHGAFLSTDLDAQLKARGATQIVLTGVSTSSGVEGTARSAYELGYHVAVAVDATTDTAEANFHAAVNLTFPKLAEVTNTAEVLAALTA